MYRISSNNSRELLFIFPFRSKRGRLFEGRRLVTMDCNRMGLRAILGLVSSVFSKFSQNCLSREATRAIWKTLKIQVKIILNCSRADATTCLSHKG